jgi:TFIIF-interacting CTD phosphatase-like protein
MNTYYTGHLVKALIGANSTAVEHLSETIVAMKKAMIIRMPSQIEIQNKKIVLNCSPKDKRKTLLVELEQTLLHLVGKKEHENDVEVGTGSSKFYVSLRPYLFSFLKKIKQFYEIVIFTTLPTSRANQILEELDPDRKLIFDCLGSEHCSTIKNDASCKDIRIVNRSIKEMCLIDSKPNSLILHPENSIPILPYKGLQ